MSQDSNKALRAGTMEASTKPNPPGFFSRLWALIMYKINRRPVKPAQMKDPVILPDIVTAEALIDSLNPEGLGKLDGQRNDPRHDKGARGAGEHRIIARVCDLRQEWEEHSNFWAQKHNEDVRNAATSAQNAGIDSLLIHAKQQMTNLVQHGYRSIKEIEKQVEDSLKRKVAERERYDCEGEPERGGDLIKHLTYVATFLVAETIVNGYFLGIQDKGLLEGWALASLISFLNGGIGFTTAYLCKGIIHESNMYRKTIGLLTFFVGLVTLGFINLLVGHIRDRLSELNLDPTITSSGSATIDAVEKVFALQPMLDGMSYFMAAVGALIAILAIIAGWAAKSPHPRYLQAFEQHKERRGQLLREKRRFDVDCSDMFRQFLEKFMEAEEAATSQSKPKVCLYYDKAKSTRSMAVARIRTLEGVGGQILDIYRGANESERSIESQDINWVPVEWPPLNLVEVMEPPTLSEVQEGCEFEATCKEATEELDQHFKELKEKFPW